MPYIQYIITFLWLLIIAYWIVSFHGIKKDIHTSMWGRSILLRITIFIIAVIVINVFISLTHIGYYLPGPVGIGGTISTDPLSVSVGLILCIVGIAFAIWARYHIGANWSGRPSVKENHELVTSGPYAYVRHPIYTGIIAALFGSALALGGAWIVIFIVFTCVFIYRIPVEEGIMMKLFPTAYPEYRKKTKVLIPFVF